MGGSGAPWIWASPGLRESNGAGYRYLLIPNLFQLSVNHHLLVDQRANDCGPALGGSELSGVLFGFVLQPVKLRRFHACQELDSLGLFRTHSVILLKKKSRG